MTAAIMFAIAFALTVATIVGVARPQRKRAQDAQDYVEQEDRPMRAAAKGREGQP